MRWRRPPKLLLRSCGTDESNGLWRTGAKLLAARARFDGARSCFSQPAGDDVGIGDRPDALSDLSARRIALAEARHLLHDWSACCRVRNRAITSRLGTLVEHVEGGVVPADQARAAFRLG